MKKRKIRFLGHNIRSLWNVGSFFRTCDAMKVERIYLTGYTGVPPRKEISKVAIGAEEFVKWEQHVEPMKVLKDLKKKGWSLVALEITKTAIDLNDYEPADKVCLIVGHELTGVPEDILALCDETVEIAMLGKKESLNVAVASGIPLHHIRSA